MREFNTSLLHIELNKLEYVFNKCYKALKKINLIEILSGLMLY